MATTLSDTFTGTNGTAVASRRPDSSATFAEWSEIGLFGTTPTSGSSTIQSNALQIANDNNGVLIDSACVDGEISFTFTPAVGALNRASCLFRSNADASFFHRILMREDNGDILLTSGTDVSSTTISSDLYSWVEGTTYAVKIVLSGTSCTVYINDVQILTGTVPSDTAKRYVGFVRATGSSTTAIDSLAVTSNTVLGLDDLVPNSTATCSDGTRSFFFFCVDGVLKCIYGVDSVSLQATRTNNTTDLSGVGNSGKSFSIASGKVGATWYAFGLVSSASTGNGMIIYRWELTSGGLGVPVVLNTTQAAVATDSHSILNRDYGSETINELYAITQIYNSDAVGYSTDETIGAATSEGSVNPTREFPEHHRMFKLSDGYLLFATDSGQSDDGDYTANGTAYERTKNTLGAAWSIEADVTGTGAGSFQDQSYALSASHAGQQGLCQLNDGTIYCCYVDDSGTTGDFGNVILRKRTGTLAGAWSTVSTDVIGSSGKAWHVGIQTDGTDIYIYWIPDSGGALGTTIKSRRYDVSGVSFGSVKTVWTAASGTPKRFSLGAYSSATTRSIAIKDSIGNLQTAFDSSGVTVTPTVTTAAATAETSSGATVGGNVTDDGGATVTSRGVYWALTTGPTAGDNVETAGAGGTGAYTVPITGVAAETTVYVVAWATNSAGTATGSEIDFTTLAAGAGDGASSKLIVIVVNFR